MTPWDLIVWALAAAVALVIVGLAIATVIVCINGARETKPSRSTPPGQGSTSIFRGQS